MKKINKKCIYLFIMIISIFFIINWMTVISQAANDEMSIEDFLKSKFSSYDWNKNDYNKFFVDLDYANISNTEHSDIWKEYHNDIIIPLRDKIFKDYKVVASLNTVEQQISDLLWENPGIMVKSNGEKITDATIDEKIINEYFEKSSESETTETESEQLADGVYKGNNNYYCTAKVAIEVWGTDVKDAIRAKIVMNNSQIDGHYDLYAVIEKYQTDINKIKVFFNSIDTSTNKPTGNYSTIYTNIQLKDVEGYETEENTMESDNNVVDQLGGILLRPIFALVNYIADSVMRVTGEIMYPEAYNIPRTAASGHPKERSAILLIHFQI